MAEAKKKIKGLSVATRCESIDQFVAMFHKFVDDDSFFIATKDVRPVGLETAFAIRLADKTVVLRGTCVVLQVWANAANPFRQPGLRLGVKRLAASSMPIFERLLVTRNPQLRPDLIPAGPSVVVDEALLRAPEPPPRWDSSPVLVASSTVPPSPRLRRARAIVAGAAVGIVAIAIAVPFALATTTDDAPTTSVAIDVAPPAPRAPLPAPPPTAAPAPPDPTCQIRVTSTPTAATVLLDGKPVGPTPLSLAATCERHEVELAHVRYAPATRWVTPTADQPSTVELALARPTHQLLVTTSPPGATIVLDGDRVGTTPTVLHVPGFSVLDLAFVRRGFHTTTARYYSKVPRDHLSVQMAK